MRITNNISAIATILNEIVSIPKRKAIAFLVKNESSIKVYAAEEGMTWLDWIESNYNSDGFLIGSYNYIHITSGKYLRVNRVIPDANSYIIDGCTYEAAISDEPEPH